MTESSQSGRPRGRARRAAGRPSGEPEPTTAVQFTEPTPPAGTEGGKRRSDERSGQQSKSSKARGKQDDGARDTRAEERRVGKADRSRGEEYIQHKTPEAPE